MEFRSDNAAGVHELISQSLVKHAAGSAAPYGTSDLDAAVEQKLAEIFEHSLSHFPVATGTAANALALTSMAKPGGMVFAHAESHVIVDECGAPEYLSGQLRLIPVGGSRGKMDISELQAAVQKTSALDVHGGRPVAITVTQPTEGGTAYTLEELDAISSIAKQHNLFFHMDGARFANGLVGLDCSPAEMTWKRGVDVLSFGATKNGCWCADTVIFFDHNQARDFPYLRKRAGQLLSKARFVSAQFEAYLHDGLWLKLAQHANDMGASLANVFRKSASAKLPWDPVGNEIFVQLSNLAMFALQESHVKFMEWPVPAHIELQDNEKFCRFVTSFATTQEDVDGVARILSNEKSEHGVGNGGLIK